MHTLRRHTANSFRISQTDNRRDLLFLAGVRRARSQGYYESSKGICRGISMAQEANIKNSGALQKAIRKRAAELYWAAEPC
jgi:hypothetical protein